MTAATAFSRNDMLKDAVLSGLQLMLKNESCLEMVQEEIGLFLFRDCI